MALLTNLNDGYAVHNPYGKISKIPPSFSNVDYYDVAVPYNLTNEQLGGYLTTTLTDTEVGTVYQPMSDAFRARTVIDYINFQNFDAYPESLKKYDHFYVYYIPKGIVTKELDAETNCWMLKKNGVSFYQSAVPPYFLRRSPYMSAPTDGFYPYSSGSVPNANTAVNTGNRGQLFDIILVDGTCIHCVLVDVMSMKDGNSGDPAFPPNNHPNSQTEFAPSDYTQYHNIESCVAGSAVELRGQVPSNTNDWNNYPNVKFSTKYNLGKWGIPGTNKIAFYRMYNAKIQDGNFIVNPKAVATGSVNNKSYALKLKPATPTVASVFYAMQKRIADPLVYKDGVWVKLPDPIYINRNRIKKT